MVNYVRGGSKGSLGSLGKLASLYVILHWNVDWNGSERACDHLRSLISVPGDPVEPPLVVGIVT